MGSLTLKSHHRVLCGDSTDPADLGRLMQGEKASLVHADPPYGMGKESEGVLNDNLYNEKLDAFQMAWWNALRPHVEDNGSVYIWGTAPDLWRLWYTELAQSGDLTMRNEIVWDKGSGMGMNSEQHHSYPTATERVFFFLLGSERALFFMLGQQFLGNQNLDDYWEGYEPLRGWLNEQMKKVGWKAADVNRITETQMAGHWLGKSQFQIIGDEHYRALQVAAGGRAFDTPYDELLGKLFAGARDGGNNHPRDLSAALRETRSYFDNNHANMTDVWNFKRVVGEERFGHATPKPVEMMERAIKSSSQRGEIVAEPFAGSGSTLMAAERMRRRCYTMELDPTYCDVVVRRWEAYTGKKAVLNG